MLELELQQYLLRKYPQENARCEWKEFKNLKNSFCGDEKNDVISYVSAIANMEGGYLVIGVKDKTFLLALPKTRTNCLLTQKQKDWTRRGCVKWYYNISAMQEMKVLSEIVYTNTSKMCYLPTRRKSSSCACLEIY